MRRRLFVFLLMCVACASAYKIVEFTQYDVFSKGCNKKSYKAFHVSGVPTKSADPTSTTILEFDCDQQRAPPPSGVVKKGVLVTRPDLDKSGKTKIAQGILPASGCAEILMDNGERYGPAKNELGARMIGEATAKCGTSPDNFFVSTVPDKRIESNMKMTDVVVASGSCWSNYGSYNYAGRWTTKWPSVVTGLPVQPRSRMIKCDEASFKTAAPFATVTFFERDNCTGIEKNTNLLGTKDWKKSQKIMLKPDASGNSAHGHWNYTVFGQYRNVNGDLVKHSLLADGDRVVFHQKLNCTRYTGDGSLGPLGQKSPGSGSGTPTPSAVAAAKTVEISQAVAFANLANAAAYTPAVQTVYNLGYGKALGLTTGNAPIAFKTGATVTSSAARRGAKVTFTATIKPTFTGTKPTKTTLPAGTAGNTALATSIGKVVMANKPAGVTAPTAANLAVAAATTENAISSASYSAAVQGITAVSVLAALLANCQ